jgi:flagellar biosynthesis chaperone FliJ
MEVTLSTKADWNRRLEAVRLYNILGNLRTVAEQLDIDHTMLASWKRSEWWPELMDEIRTERKSKQSVKINNLINQSLDHIEDRLTNGDWILNNKTGELIRKPVALREATTVANNLLTRQAQIEELESKVNTTKETVQETLKTLADEFKKYSRKQARLEATEIEFKEVTDAVHEKREAGLQT